MSEKAKSRRGIQSIEVGGKLLSVLVESHGPLSLGDLARQSGMPASKAHPYLVSYCNLGLVEQDATTGHYGLGPFAIQLGLVGLQQLSPIRLAIPEITKLGDTIDQTVALAVWGTHGPTVIYIVESTFPVQIAMRPGSVMSMLGTATGLVFSAFSPSKLVQKMIERELRDPDVLAQVRAPVSQKTLEAKLNEVRERKLARAQNEPIPGISAFSAPVFDHTCAMVLAITATGPSIRFNSDWNGPIATTVKACAERLSHVLGYSS